MTAEGTPRMLRLLSVVSAFLLYSGIFLVVYPIWPDVALVALLPVLLAAGFLGLRAGVAAALVTPILLSVFVWVNGEGPLTYLEEPSSIARSVALLIIAVVVGWLRSRRNFYRTQLAAIERRAVLLEKREKALVIHETFSQSSPTLLLRITGEGVVQWWNPAAGESLELVEGQTHLADLIPKLNKTSLVNTLVSGRAAHVATMVEGRAIEWTIQGLLGGEMGLVYGDDVTDLRQIQQRLNRAAKKAKAGEKAKSEFLATMSHEIRTPLHGVLGMVRLLLRTELTDDQRHFAKTIESSGNSLLGILNQVLDLARLEARTVPDKVEPFDLIELVESSAALIATNAAVHDLALSVEIGEGVPRGVCGDSGYLGQILVNLLNNALKFTPKGEISVRVFLLSASEDRARLHFEVRDTGIGIPEHQVEAIFGEFAQVDPSATRGYGGTGLGLAIARRLATAIKGELGVSSVDGEGSIFWLRVTFDIDPKKRIPVYDFEGLKVLILEPNETTRGAMRRYLARLGAIVEGFQGPVPKYPDVDVAIVDARLDFESEKRPECPMIAVTALGARRTEELRESGYKAVLRRPVGLLHLLDAVGRVSGRGVSAEPIQSSGGSTVDFAVLLKRVGPEASLDDVLGRFLTHADRSVRNIHRAAKSGDMEEMRRIASALNTEALDAGATRLGASCYTISQVEGDSSEIVPLLADIAACYRDTKDALRLLRDYQRPPT